MPCVCFQSYIIDRANLCVCVCVCVLCACVFWRGGWVIGCLVVLFLLFVCVADRLPALPVADGQSLARSHFQGPHSVHVCFSEAVPEMLEGSWRHGCAAVVDPCIFFEGPEPHSWEAQHSFVFVTRILLSVFSLCTAQVHLRSIGVAPV